MPHENSKRSPERQQQIDDLRDTMGSPEVKVALGTLPIPDEIMGFIHDVMMIVGPKVVDENGPHVGPQAEAICQTALHIATNMPGLMHIMSKSTEILMFWDKLKQDINIRNLRNSN